MINVDTRKIPQSHISRCFLILFLRNVYWRFSFCPMSEMAERHDVPQVLMMARDLVHKVQTLIENKWRRTLRQCLVLFSSVFSLCDRVFFKMCFSTLPLVSEVSTWKKKSQLVNITTPYAKVIVWTRPSPSSVPSPSLCIQGWKLCQ